MPDTETSSLPDEIEAELRRYGALEALGAVPSSDLHRGMNFLATIMLRLDAAADWGRPWTPPPGTRELLDVFRAEIDKALRDPRAPSIA
jgi:hypothetical protein